jgi:hypothetical protein
VTAPLSPDQTSAKAIIQAQLDSWGLTALAPDLDRLIKDGLGSSAITLQLQQTQAYQDRFAGNKLRQQAGLPVLSPAEYISAESSYRQVLQSYGLPAQFYDQPEDFHQFIAKDVSPDEVNSRAQAAQQSFLNADPGIRQALRDMYGLSDGAGIALFLDEERALPIVQRMATAGQIGGSAIRNGLATDTSRFEQYADMGITGAQAADAFSRIGQTQGIYSSIAARNGTTFDQAQNEQATLVGSASALKKQTQLAGSEKALFDTRASADKNSLTRRTSGSF